MWFINTLFLLFWGFAYADTQCPYVDTIQDRRQNKNQLRLMQYNVEWLFVDYYSGSDCPGNGCTWKNESAAITHLNAVANVIDKLQPDIINFCEVEGCDELNMLTRAISNTDYLPYLIKGTDSSTGQNVGMLTKMDPVLSLYRDESRYDYPIDGSTCGYTGSTSSTAVSKHYITEFFINDVNIAFIAAHLIAIPTDPSRCAQREAQASILQSIIYSYIQDGYEIVMIGDFNDYDNEIPDINSNKPISQVLDILKGYGANYELYSVGLNVSQNERYSDWWDSDNNCNTSSINDYSVIDHILVSKKIQSWISNVFIYHGYDEFCNKINSDHYPVIVDLEL
jgi:exonuclease III